MRTSPVTRFVTLPAKTCKRVVFPLPDLPIIAIISWLQHSPDTLYRIGYLEDLPNLMHLLTLLNETPQTSDVAGAVSMSTNSILQLERMLQKW